jgi:uncharacterized Zn ribbon protein
MSRMHHDENGYRNGSTNFVCIACGYELFVALQNEDGDNGDEDKNNDIIRDSTGNIMESGDTVVVRKESGMRV